MPTDNDALIHCLCRQNLPDAGENIVIDKAKIWGNGRVPGIADQKLREHGIIYCLIRGDFFIRNAVEQKIYIAPRCKPGFRFGLRGPAVAVKPFLNIILANQPRGFKNIDGCGENNIVAFVQPHLASFQLIGKSLGQD